MDTRNKIVATLPPNPPRPFVVVTAYFDPLLSWHAKEIENIRGRAHSVAAIVTPRSDELLEQRARAELAASLRMIDYVLIANSGDLSNLIADVYPDEVVRLEVQESHLRRELIEHVHRRHDR